MPLAAGLATSVSHARAQQRAPSCKGRLSVVCGSRPDSPYEPLEKAIRVINRVIALGERTKWGAGDEGSGSSSSNYGGGTAGQPAPAERWVQFGAVYNSRVSVEQPSLAAGQRGTQPASAAQQQEQQQQGQAGSSGSSASADSSSKQLADYLALPIEEYSLLDPKWISREEGRLFRFCLPLQDLVNVDLQPEITFSVTPELEQRRVTLAGTRAALGSPELDQAFRLNVSAVVSQRNPRRLPVPDHLPGRPVYRLRRWAAAARGRTWPPPAGSPAGAAGSSNGSGSPAAGPAASQAAAASADAAGAAAVAAAAAAAAGAAPFPSQHVYISHDAADDSDEYEGSAAELAGAEVALAELEVEAEEAPGSAAGPSGNGAAAASAAEVGSIAAAVQWQPQAPSAAAASSSNGSGARDGRQALLHCRAHVTMAVRVPGALKVVPNALLGYAGSLLLRAVLTATLPNFLDLLAADYRRWAGLAGAAGGPDRGSQLDAPVGELFRDAAATVREGKERRQAEGASPGSAGEEEGQPGPAAQPAERR